VTSGDGYFDEQVAAGYDDDESIHESSAEDIEVTVSFLAELAGDGAALEFAVGTGRIALPLAWRGVPTSGIDLSRPMLARLEAKDPEKTVAVTVGDIATSRVEGSFRLVYLICNTIMNLTTQEAQVACFRNAAAHLDTGGRFVIKVMIPELRTVPPGETMQVFDAGEEHWGIDEYDFAGQGLISHHFDRHGDGSFERTSMPFRYVWPAELDLMAQLAGMRLIERWEGWRREPFTSESKQHVSVWEKAVLTPE
jgi:SAM-dependent methyltransferase